VAAAVVHFRRLLKAEMGVFLPLVALRPLEKAPLSVAHRMAALQLLRDCAASPGLLADLFANYDCDLEAANLFERMLLALTQVCLWWCGVHLVHLEGRSGILCARDFSVGCRLRLADVSRRGRM
jgi:hypothetical protein